MSHIEQRLSRQEDALTAEWLRFTAVTEPASCNTFTGTVISRTEGLTRTTLRIRVGTRTDLHVRWSGVSPVHDAVRIGQTVRLTIPEEAVQLEAGGFRRGKQRWNRWIGRVVLVERNGDGPVTTVKIHRDIITLKSRHPVIGACGPLTTWDTVNIVVDPQQVRLTPSDLLSPAVTDSDPFPFATPPQASVWLHATIQSLRWSPAGHHVSLDVDGANLSVLLETDGEISRSWTLGSPVEINISYCGARIRRGAHSLPLRGRIVFSNEPATLERFAPAR
ncbi:MAG: hypothetical protein KF693_19240 [Nitrospira sp.]|nr:hypothetical protein [Nitrospira sp.]